MDIKIKKLLAYVGCLWIGILSQASAAPLTMEDVLREIRASYRFNHIADGEISYEKLERLGIAEEAERIVQMALEERRGLEEGGCSSIRSYPCPPFTPLTPEEERMQLQEVAKSIYGLYRNASLNALCPSSRTFTMEGILKAIRASYSFAYLADGPITYKKLERLGIAKKAKRILQTGGDRKEVMKGIFGLYREASLRITCPITMEEVLREIRASHHLAAGEISYEKLRRLGIAEKAERILKERFRFCTKIYDPESSSDSESAEIRETTCQGVAEEIYRLYCAKAKATDRSVGLMQESDDESDSDRGGWGWSDSD
jgi:hypothetical protein